MFGFSTSKKSSKHDQLDGLIKDYVDGHAVYFDRRARRGVRYLDHDLSAKEARVFFMHARRHKKAQFEDDRDHQYTLSYLGNKKYMLERR